MNHPHNPLQPKVKPWLLAVRIAVLAILYFLAGEVSLSISLSHRIIALDVFAAEGIALAAILLFGFRLWPGIFLGQLALAYAHGMPPETALGMAAINSMEALIAAHLFRRLDISPSLDRMRDVAKLHLLIMLVLQPFNATLSTGLLWLNHSLHTPAEYGNAWFSWWLTNVLGQILLVPMLLTFFSRKQTFRLFFREELLMLLPLFLAGLLVFRAPAFINESVAFAIMTPILALIALRRGMVAATSGVALIAGMAVYHTHFDMGPFVGERAVSHLGLNAFLFFTAITVQFTTALFAERTHLEEDLGRSQQMMRLVLDRFPGVVFWKDRQSVYLGCNDSFAKAVGLDSPAQIVGKTDFDLPWTQAASQDYQAEDQEVMRQGKPKIGVVERQHHAGGRTLWLHTNKLPLLDGNGAPVGVLGASTDITALKQAEDELRLNAEAHKKINQMVVDILHHSWNTRESPAELAAYLAKHTGDTLNVDIVTVWVYSDEDQKLYSLARYHQLTGIQGPQTAYDMTDMRPYMNLTAESRYTAIHNWNAATAAATPDFLEKIIRPYGIKSTLSAPIRRHGRQLGMVSLSQTREQKNWTPEEGSAVATLADVMGQIITEDELHRTQEEINQLNTTLEQKVIDRTAQLEEARRIAEEAAQSKSTFLATMSHEIRTPMNGVLGMADLLASTPLNDEQRDWLETLRSSGQSLLGLLNDILDFSKMEAGRLGLEQAPFEIKAQIHSVASLLDGKAAEKNLRMTTRVDPGVPPALIGDALRLRQVLTNLVGNAIKFTEEGRIDIHVALDPPPPQAPEWMAHLHFTVTDTGVGIPQASLPKLFQPFTQADASTTRQFGGTGLGLSICKLLIERMGGRIWLESSPQGTTCHVTLSLPVADAAPAAEDETVHAMQTPAAKSREVLLVEDNPVNQKVCVAMLTKRGHRVTLANDGREALDAIATKPFDIILMDVQMPGMDGLEATAHIRRRESQRHEPRRHIVAMTAHSMGGDRDRCLNAGMDEYMCKPFRAEELYALVEANRAQAPFAAPAGAPAASPPGAPDEADRADPAANLALALDMVAGERAILEDAARAYLHEHDCMLAAVRDAITGRNAHALHVCAHSLKGTVSLFQAGAARAAALALEQMGRTEQWADAEEGLARLERELMRLNAQLGQWLG